MFLFRIVTLKKDTWSTFIDPSHVITKRILINYVYKTYRRMYVLFAIKIAYRFVSHNFRQIINFPYLHEILFQ